MANGVTRIVLSDNVGKGQSALNSAMKNANDVAKKVKSFPSKNTKKKK